MGWKPIETAPKYGVILAMNHDGIVHQCEVNRFGFYSISSGSYMSPTHWMTLPEPPKGD